MPDEIMNFEVENITAESPIEEALETIDTDEGSSVVSTVVKIGLGIAIGAAGAIGIPKLVKHIKAKKAAKITSTTQKVDCVDKLLEEKKAGKSEASKEDEKETKKE